jgi:somatostatin receptor 2
LGPEDGLEADPYDQSVNFTLSASDVATQRILGGISQFFFVLICIVGLCGNTLVIYVVVRYNKMQTVTNLYILNLAIADECFLIGLPFLLVTSIMKHWPFGYVVCKVYMTTTGINQFTSSAFLTVMSGDR